MNTFPEQYGIQGDPLKQQTNGILYIQPDKHGGSVKSVHGGFHAYQKIVKNNRNPTDNQHWNRSIQYHHVGPLHPDAMYSTNNIIIKSSSMSR
jgi:hypothetical protein